MTEIDLSESDIPTSHSDEIPPIQIEKVEKAEGRTGYLLTDGVRKFQITNPHDIDLSFASEVFGIPTGEIFRAQLRYMKTHDDYEISHQAKNDFFKDDERFIPKLLAQKIVNIEQLITNIHSKETYVWRDGYYQPIGEQVIAQHVKTLLGEEHLKKRLAEVVAYIKADTYTEFIEPPRTLINLKNGIFDLKTGELRPHEPEFHFFQVIPVEYNPDAKAPLTHSFLREIIASEEDALVLEEVAGYCLFRDTPIHKALMLVGEGANGKSTYLNLIKRFLGCKNVSGKSLQELEFNRFAEASLFGKLANIYPDLPDKSLKRTGTFKMLTGGDLIDAEKKFRDSFTFTNYAKLLFSCNKMPEVNDNTDAFFRRWIIIVFPNQFKDEDCDTQMLEKITTPEELSGFLKIALEGLKRLLTKNKFTYSKTIEEIREDYIRKSDPLGAFVLDCLEENSEGEIIKQDLFNVFAAYCRERNLPTVNSDTFFKNIPKHINLTQIRLNRKDIQGRPYAYKGASYTDYALQWSNQSNQSTLLITLGKPSDANNTKEYRALDSLDSLDHNNLVDKKIGITCGSCEVFHNQKCPKPNPLLIQRDAGYANSCDYYLPKSEGCNAT